MLADAVGEKIHEAVEFEQVLKAQNPAVVALFVMLVFLFAGICGFHWTLGLTWTAAFYFATATSLTVGYGDIDAWSAMSAPELGLHNSTSAESHGMNYTPTVVGMVFTIFYIISGSTRRGSRTTDSALSSYPISILRNP